MWIMYLLADPVPEREQKRNVLYHNSSISTLSSIRFENHGIATTNFCFNIKNPTQFTWWDALAFDFNVQWELAEMLSRIPIPFMPNLNKITVAVWPLKPIMDQKNKIWKTLTEMVISAKYREFNAHHFS